MFRSYPFNFLTKRSVRDETDLFLSSKSQRYSKHNSRPVADFMVIVKVCTNHDVLIVIAESGSVERQSPYINRMLIHREAKCPERFPQLEIPQGHLRHPFLIHVRTRCINPDRLQ